MGFLSEDSCVKESRGSPLEHKRKLQETLAASLPINRARLTCLSLVILALIQEKSVNLANLSLAFQGKTKPESSYRRLKRFFAEVRLDQLQVARLILSLLPPPPYTLCVDRTNWQFGRLDINLLVIAIAYRGTAFPVVWTLLDKPGNSSSAERIDLLKRCLVLVKAKDVTFLLADREFIGETWFHYLDERRVPFAIRIRKDSLCDNLCSVSTLFVHLPTGELKLLTHRYRIYGCNVRLAGMKLSAHDYAIIATNQPPAQAFLAYQRRWDIEMLFSALKTTGFDLESTHLAHAKLDTLFALLAITFAWSHYVGQWLHDTRRKPLRRKSHLRLEKSFFRHGLDHLRHLLKNLPFKHQDLLLAIRLLSRT